MTSLQDESASCQIINSTEFLGLARFIFLLMPPSKSFLGILPSLFNIKQTNKHTSSSHGFSSTLYAAPINGDWGSQAPPGCESRTSAKPCAVLGRKDQAQPRQARPGVRKCKVLASNRTKNHWNYGQFVVKDFTRPSYATIRSGIINSSPPAQRFRLKPHELRPWLTLSAPAS